MTRLRAENPDAARKDLAERFHLWRGGDCDSARCPVRGVLHRLGDTMRTAESVGQHVAAVLERLSEPRCDHGSQHRCEEIDPQEV